MTDMRMVALDLDGTLVDQEGAAGRWAAEFVDANGLAVPVEQIAVALKQRRPKGEVFAELISAHGLSLDAMDVWADYRRRMPQLVTCTDADRDALVQLRRAGWRVGIVTNGMVDNQEGKIRALGLDDLVDAWVISDDVGIRKPDPEIFKILAERLRAPLDGWMVGDSIELDVAGGHGVGLQTAFISAGDAPRSEATIEVRSVADAVVAILSSES